MVDYSKWKDIEVKDNEIIANVSCLYRRLHLILYADNEK